MKIGLVNTTTMSDVYGEKYNSEFFQNLWRECLLGRPGIDELCFYDFPASRRLHATLQDEDAFIGAWITDGLISEEFLSNHPKLKYIATSAHGYGTIDKEACQKHGVTVTNTVYGDVTIAQYTMALLLDICHNIGLHDDYYKNKKWLEPESNRMMRIFSRQIELYGKTMGIIGLGSIGYQTAGMAAGFGMKILANSRTKKTDSKYDFIEQVTLDELLERSDVISIHCPYTPQTHQLINRQTIQKMKDGVILLNTARGDIIEEPALIEALNSGKIYAAGLDVVANEPIKEPCELMKCKNTRITEHIAWLPVEARIRSVQLAAENFLNWMDGHPTSVISI